MHRLAGRLQALRAEHVARDADGRATGCIDFICNGLRRLLADIEHRYLHAGGREILRKGAAQHPAATGDDGHAALQIFML